jgi:hypothetical protein
MKFNLIIVLCMLLCVCSQENSKIETNPLGKTLLTRIQTPEGYEWIIEESGTFGEFLQNAPLKKEGSQILDFSQNTIGNQYEHVAILDYDIGKKDLQQCADAVIRLRAEYLFQQKRFEEIRFQFTSGDFFSWNDYKIGIRPQLMNITKSYTKVYFKLVANKDDSYRSFRNYLDVIFMYAGTISLNNESLSISNNKNILTGDFIVTPGSPGHAVIIVGRAKNKQGEVIFLLAQGYTPAQSIHVITNPLHSEVSPWYTLDVSKSPTITARYTFKKTNIRTFKKE